MKFTVYFSDSSKEDPVNVLQQAPYLYLSIEDAIESDMKTFNIEEIKGFKYWRVIIEEIPQKEINAIPDGQA